MPLISKLKRVRAAIAWRLHHLLGDRLVYGSLLAFTRLWRRLMARPVFIGIVGSAGKTTAKELMVGMFSHKGKAIGNRASYNNLEEIAMAMLKVRPWHTGFVTELSEDRPGVTQRQCELVRPTVGIVTVVRDDHMAAYSTREALASEMQSLVTILPAHGTAVLNADDPQVLAMAAQCRAKVITYGVSATADLRARDVSSVWPQRLRMTLDYKGTQVAVQTQLVGTHWLPSVLGAVGGGLAAGLSLQDCADGLAGVPPFEGRMQPVTTPQGVTFIRDDFKAPLWTLEACFDVMRNANAKRKIIVIGEISDVGASKGLKYARVAKLTREIADVTVIVGPWSTGALTNATANPEGVLRAYGNVVDASRYLKSILQAGDLVLLKGTCKQDHLERLVLDQTGTVNCWRDDCGKQDFCNACPDLLKPSGFVSGTLPAQLMQQAGPTRAEGTSSGLFQTGNLVLVGLGNSGAEFARTPHNIGFEFVDQVAQRAGMHWQDHPLGRYARGQQAGRPVCLIKLHGPMNLTGPSLAKASLDFGFAASDCVLVYDDLSLPLGTVRARLSGSAGGHKGVASVLEAFQTTAFRRIKIGIAVSGALAPSERLIYVLTPIAENRRAVVQESFYAANALLDSFLTDQLKAP